MTRSYSLDSTWQHFPINSFAVKTIGRNEFICFYLVVVIVVIVVYSTQTFIAIEKSMCRNKRLTFRFEFDDGADVGVIVTDGVIVRFDPVRD